MSTGICGPYAFVERSPHRLWLGYVVHSRLPYTHREARRTKHVSRETCEKDFLGAHLAGLRGSKCAWSWVERWHSAGLPRGLGGGRGCGRRLMAYGARRVRLPSTIRNAFPNAGGFGHEWCEGNRCGARPVSGFSPHMNTYPSSARIPRLLFSSSRGPARIRAFGGSFCFT